MKKILIVEDNLQVSKLYQRKFAEEGYEIVLAQNGQDGLIAAAKEEPSLVILDVVLPGKLNGFDVLEGLKKNENTKNIPVIMVTNLETEEKTAREIGVADYLVKVDTPLEEVIQRVKELC